VARFPRAGASLVSSDPLFPQDKEHFGSDTSHEENVIFIFEESRTFHFNQRFTDDITKYI
jgi:hypothetical protein